RRHTRFSRDWSSDVCSSDLRTPLSSKSPKSKGHSDGLGTSITLHLPILVEESGGVELKFAWLTGTGVRPTCTRDRQCCNRGGRRCRVGSKYISFAISSP